MSKFLPQGRSRPLCADTCKRTPHLIALGLAATALVAGLTFTRGARADIWGYIDDTGRSHLASEKVDDRYTLFFKGGVRVDKNGTPFTNAAVNASEGKGADGTAGDLQGDSKLAEVRLADGKLADARVGATETAAPKALPPALAHFEPLINQYAKMHNVDPALVKAVIAVESAFQPGVVSAKGALGLMQIIPDTGQRYGVTGDRKQSVQQKLFDPATNLKVGTRYLRDLLGMFAQNIELALAAYNAGEGNVMKYKNKVPPFAETREYVKKVQKLYVDFKPVPVARPQASAPATSPRSRLLLPGQRVPVAGLVPIAADIATSIYPSAIPFVTSPAQGEPAT